MMNTLEKTIIAALAILALQSIAVAATGMVAALWNNNETVQTLHRRVVDACWMIGMPAIIVAAVALEILKRRT